MSTTTLCVGGPFDGQLRELEDGQREFYVMEPHRVYSTYNDEPTPSGMRRVPTPGHTGGSLRRVGTPGHSAASADVPIRKTAYVPRVVNFFGEPLRVHVHESVLSRPADFQRKLRRHLMNDTARAVKL